MHKFVLLLSVVCLLMGFSVVGAHGDEADCEGLPSHDALAEALVAARGTDNGGFGLEMWGSIVNRDGVVCAVFGGTAGWQLVRLAGEQSGGYRCCIWR